MQPGDVVGPGANPPEDTNKPVEQPQSPPAETPKQPEPPAEAAESVPDSNWQFSAADDQAQAGNYEPPTPQETVTWTASEYIAHEKAGNWYFLLALAVIGLAAIVFLLTREWVSPVVIVVMGIAFGSFAARKPEELTYTLDNTSLKIGPKTYPYAQFKSFTVMEEGPIHSIMLMPLQRFMPPLSVYYDPKDEDNITEALSAYLPYEDRKQDAVDRLMRRVRF